MSVAGVTDTPTKRIPLERGKARSLASIFRARSTSSGFTKKTVRMKADTTTSCESLVDLSVPTHRERVDLGSMSLGYDELVAEVVRLRKLDRQRRQISEEAEVEARRLRHTLDEKSKELEELHEHIQKACNENDCACAKELSARCTRVILSMKKT